MEREAQVVDRQSVRRNSLIALPIGALLIGHYAVDAYSSLLPPILGVVEHQYFMLPGTAALLLGVGSICSGLAQPLFAWISDRLKTRIFATAGVTLSALAISTLGFAPNSFVVFLLYAIGMTGVGMFHPIAASAIGRIAGNRRGMALGWFFVFGMGGFFTGSLVGPSFATGSGGLRSLWFLVVPGLVVAAAIQVALGKMGVAESRRMIGGGAEDEPAAARYDWYSIGLLYVTAVIRFVVNTAIIYLLLRWVEQYVAELHPEWTDQQVADYSAPVAGRANAVMFVGQAIGGLVAGTYIAAGREKMPLIFTPILFSPAIMALAFTKPGWWGLAACFLVGISFSSMTPVTISMGQRLMPNHTNLASGLLLGGAWVIASIGPMIAEVVIQRFDLGTAIISCGCFLALSGIVAMGLNSRSLAGGTSQHA
jgi:FSR family fosmidomycin resistance protein-like MFS transporter